MWKLKPLFRLQSNIFSLSEPLLYDREERQNSKDSKPVSVFGHFTLKMISEKMNFIFVIIWNRSVRNLFFVTKLFLSQNRAELRVE